MDQIKNKAEYPTKNVDLQNPLSEVSNIQHTAQLNSRSEKSQLNGGKSINANKENETKRKKSNQIKGEDKENRKGSNVTSSKLSLPKTDDENLQQTKENSRQQSTQGLIPHTIVQISSTIQNKGTGQLNSNDNALSKPINLQLNSKSAALGGSININLNQPQQQCTNSISQQPRNLACLISSSSNNNANSQTIKSQQNQTRQDKSRKSQIQNRQSEIVFDSKNTQSSLIESQRNIVLVKEPKRCWILRKCGPHSTDFRKKFQEFIAANTIGRSKIQFFASSIQLLWTIVWGLWDVMSDWIYFFTQHLSNTVLASCMQFFLVSELIIQFIAWSLILANNKLRGSNALVDITEKTKHIQSYKTYYWKVIKYSWQNMYHMIMQGIKMFPAGMAITLLQEVKIFPLLLHYYFAKRHGVILTSNIIKHLDSQLKKADSQHIKKKGLRNELDANHKLLYEKINNCEILDEECFQHSYLLPADSEQTNNENILNLALDASLKPTCSTIIFETEIKRHQKMGETIKAIFQAMPMAILQYINNSLNGKNQFLDLFLFFSLISSIYTVAIYCVQLVITLYKDDSQVILDQWGKIHRQSGHNEPATSYDFSSQYPLPQHMKIDHYKNLQKLANCQDKCTSSIKKLEIDIKQTSQGVQKYLDCLVHIIPKMENVNPFIINLSYCNLSVKQILQVLRSVSVNNCLQINFAHNQLQVGDIQGVSLSQNDNEIENSSNLSKSNSIGGQQDITKGRLAIKQLKLDFSSTNINSKILQYITKQFFIFPAAQQEIGEFEINLSSNAFGSESEIQNEFISMGMFESHLQSLKINLCNNGLSDSQVRQIFSKSLTKSSSLVGFSLDLSQNQVFDQGIMGLADTVAEKFPNLNSLQLELGGNKFSDNAMHYFGKTCVANLQKLNNLQLHLAECGLGQNGLENFSKLAFSNLKSASQYKVLKMDLRSCIVGFNQMSSFAANSLKKLTGLNNLNLNFENGKGVIGDKGIEQFAKEGLGGMTGLRSLVLNFTGHSLSHEGIWHFAKYGLFSVTKNLQTLALNFSNNAITDQGISHLIKQGFYQLNDVKELHFNLASTKITEVSMEELGQGISKLTKLTVLKLDISNNSAIGTSGIKKLIESSIRNKALKQFSLKASETHMKYDGFKSILLELQQQKSLAILQLLFQKNEIVINEGELTQTTEINKKQLLLEFMKKLRKSLRVFVCNLEGNEIKNDDFKQIINGVGQIQNLGFLHLNLKDNQIKKDEISQFLDKFKVQNQDRDYHIEL